MGVWYAHRLTTTVIMSRLPAGWPRRPEDAPFFPAGWLKAKGWPTFERAVSSQIKRAAGGTWHRIIDPNAMREDGGGGYREAPLHPRAFAARLARTIFTNGRSDCELVAGLYADTLASGFGRARTLEFSDAMWTDDEAVQLAEALPLARELTFLKLTGNRFQARGLEALAAAIREGAAPKLERFEIDTGSIHDTGWFGAGAALRAACKERGIRCGTVLA
mmetsp:Transcript_45536/g.119627  ORF Transcript_45536/g.119627 Transcript_45536/m.119627 type:complete len:219 (+) Transcript_45536:609-1265(+)